MLIEIAGVFSAHEVDEMRDQLLARPWVDGKQTAGVGSARVKINRQLAEDDAVGVNLGQRILARLSEHGLFMSGALPKRIYPPLFNRYSGGELVIRDTFGERSVKLPAGHLVLYPGSSVHRVNPVTRGERLAAFFWIESLVREDSQRSLLLDMDVSIQRLTTQQADDESLLQLSGVYHNLLRRWSDV